MVRTGIVLVAGGTGFIGRHLVRSLKITGAKVQVITRNPKPSLGDQISWETIRSKGLPAETIAVVNLAGRNILEPRPWTNSYKNEVYSSRIETNRLLADAIHKAPVKPKVFVTTSGVGYYEPSDTVEYDENWIQSSPGAGGAVSKCNYLMNLAREWENAGTLIEQHAPNTRRVIIRAGAVLGHDGGLIQSALIPFRLALGGPIGDGRQWFPWIHVSDLANLYKFAIINDHVDGIINGVAPEQIRNKQFATTFGEVVNRPAIFPMPAFAVNMVFGRDRSVILLEGQRVKSRAGLLGFRCQYPNVRSALEACIRVEYNKSHNGGP